MDVLITSLAMLAAFLIGAYIREPFSFIKKDKKEEESEIVQPDKKEEDKNDLTLENQILNMINYNGDKQDE